MRLPLARDSWVYRFGFTPAVDFCVWALEVDGLPVPPFDRHPDGDGTLRAAGLDAVSWWAWLARVIELQGAQDQALSRLAKGGPHTREEWRAAHVPEAHLPASAASSSWVSPAAARQRRSNAPNISGTVFAMAGPPPGWMAVVVEG